MRALRRGKVRVLVDVVREPATLPGSFQETISHARGAASMFRAYREAAHLPEAKEAFLSMHLDAKHCPLSMDLVSIGSLQMSVAHPREVFRPALVIGAAAIIVAHNHPSGCCKPSSEDDTVTERLREAGRILGVIVLDHIILGGSEFWSSSQGRAFPYDL